MRILADSNLLIAGLIRSHVHHVAVSPWMQAIRAKRVELVLAAHSIAETFSVMTRGPFRPAMTPAEVWNLLLTFNTRHSLRLPGAGVLRVESPLSIQPPTT